MKALVLDFDGVISDSAAEAFVVALRTYTEVWPESELRRELASLGGEAGLDHDAVAAHALFPSFVAQMPLGSRADDYAVIVSLLESGASASGPKDFVRARRALPVELLADYETRFYDQRRALSRSNRAVWLGLMGSYPELVSLLRRRAGDVALALATAKDGPTVRTLLEQYGIADLFRQGAILDKDVGESKRTHLEHLHERLQIPFPEMTFVDDKVSHLDAVAPLGVRCALAAWGYNGERERDAANANGHLVCTLESVEEQLFDDVTPGRSA